MRTSVVQHGGADAVAGGTGGLVGLGTGHQLGRTDGVVGGELRWTGGALDGA